MNLFDINQNRISSDMFKNLWMIFVNDISRQINKYDL